MAVARITAPIAWHVRVAGELADWPKLQRELLRAADRRSQMAELTADEVRELSRRFPTDVLIARALGELEASEHRDTRLIDARGKRSL